MTIKISTDFNAYEEIEYNVYPGGEVSIKNVIDVGCNSDVFIRADIKDANDIIVLCQLKDILDRLHVRNVLLCMPYIPYARQDRVIEHTSGNQSHALKVFTTLLNSLNFVSVEVWDPHSDVAAALINNVYVQPIEDFTNFLTPNIALLSPDLGAAKKIERIAAKQGITNIAYGMKHRDPETGYLTAADIINADCLEDRDVWICDDICDGGRTFLNLAEKVDRIRMNFNLNTMRRINSLNLFVTHGIFSNGIKPLVDVFDTVATVNMLSNIDVHPSITRTDYNTISMFTKKENKL